MRDVFPGEEYFQWMRPAIDQLWDLFANGLLAPAPEFQRELFSLTSGCGHPPADCRRDTYKAAMRLDPKPDCASLIGDSKKKPKPPTYGLEDDCCGDGVPLVDGMRILPDPHGVLDKMSYPECSSDWCSKHREQIAQICRELGHTDPHMKIYVMSPDGETPCYCYCH